MIKNPRSAFMKMYVRTLFLYEINVLFECFKCIINVDYTLSHLENDRDVSAWYRITRLLSRA